MKKNKSKLEAELVVALLCFVMGFAGIFYTSAYPSITGYAVFENGLAVSKGIIYSFLWIIVGSVIYVFRPRK